MGKGPSDGEYLILSRLRYNYNIVKSFWYASHFRFLSTFTGKNFTDKEKKQSKQTARLLRSIKQNRKKIVLIIISTTIIMLYQYYRKNIHHWCGKNTENSLILFLCYHHPMYDIFHSFFSHSNNFYRFRFTHITLHLNFWELVCTSSASNQLKWGRAHCRTVSMIMGQQRINIICRGIMLEYISLLLLLLYNKIFHPALCRRCHEGSIM